MTDEQQAANDMVREDLRLAFGVGFDEIITNDDLNGTGELVAVRWETTLHRDMQGALRLPAPTDESITLTGVTLVDMDNQLFERHIDWLGALHQLGFAVDTRRSGLASRSTQPLAPISQTDD